MNTHADKTQENKSQAVSAETSQLQSGGESTFQFVDNRPEAITQRKLQEMANNSPRAMQLKAFQDIANNSPQAKQTTQLQSMMGNSSAQQQQPIQKKENNTGLPDNLKTGMENLSAMSLDDVKVHRNSDKPAQLQAHAFAQGADIHLGPGQEKHLPHEAWHVVQQKQGRVKPTLQMKGKVNVNDDVGLEKEADVMGDKALHTTSQLKVNENGKRNTSEPFNSIGSNSVMQRVWGIYDGSDRDAARTIMMAVIGNTNDRAIGGVLEELIHYDETQAALSAALALMPVQFTMPRATSILAHTLAGGTNADAALAIAFAPVDPVVLNAALIMLRELNLVLGFVAFANDKKEALLAEHVNLTSDTLRTNAVAITLAAADGPNATLDLLRTRAFGFREDFKGRADERGVTAGATLVANRTNEVQDDANNKRVEAISAKDDEAFNSLTANQKKALGGTAENALKSKAPLVSNPYYDQGMGKLMKLRIEKAQNDINLIDAAEVTDIQNVNNGEGPQEVLDVVEEHRAYFAGVNFDPDALAVLDIAGEDKAIATNMVNYFVTEPSTRALYLGGMQLARKNRLLNIPTATLAAIVGAGVTNAAITEFAADNNRIAFLLALHTGAIPFGTVNATSLQLGNLAAYVANAGCRIHLATLLATDTATDIHQMLATCPGPALTKPALIVACRPNSNSVATLIYVLTQCAGFGWNQAQITACIGGQPPASNQATLMTAVHAAHLGRNDKLTAFGPWMIAVGELIVAGYVNINPAGVWFRMPQIQKSDGSMTPLTDERFYNINFVVGGAYVNNFCVHFHPLASGPSIQNPNASRSHFKPGSGGNINLSYSSGSASIKGVTESRP
jgi:hypothetical protein